MSDKAILRKNAVLRTPGNCARLFMQGMDERQRKKFKAMMEHGYVSAGSLSKIYNVPRAELMLELIEAAKEM